VLRRIFFRIWIFIFASIIILGFFPKLILTIPWIGLESIRVFLIFWTLFTFAYGIVWIYRRGMSRARSR
jgi:hypothetical protein